MSPAARRYVVRFLGWTEYETFVLAASKDEAISKAVAMFELNGAAEFTATQTVTEDWTAECVGTRS